MRPGRYAATDGSFTKSAGGAGARGLALLAVALLIGIVLLNATDADPPGATVSARGDSDTADGADDGDDTGAAATTTVPAPPTTAVPARAPKDVKVIVANASPTNGAAGAASNALKPAGYNVLAPTNAPRAPQSSVFFTPGYDRDAAAIAALLKFPPTSVKPMPAPPPFATNTANVAVVIGTAEAPSLVSTSTTAAGASGSSTTSTTAAGATSTTATTKKP